MNIGVGDKVKVKWEETCWRGCCTEAHGTYIGFIVESPDGATWTVREQNEGPTHVRVSPGSIEVLRKACEL